VLQIGEDLRRRREPSIFSGQSFVMVLVDDTLARAQAIHDKLSVDSKIEEIRTTLHQSLNNFTFATHTFAQIADAVGYLTDECITSEVMQPLIDEHNIML
jgi:aspartate/tyrosine/aromatic aminotransferase